jgi:hypothetical protein
MSVIHRPTRDTPPPPDLEARSSTEPILQLAVGNRSLRTACTGPAGHASLGGPGPGSPETPPESYRPPCGPGGSPTALRFLSATGLAATPSLAVRPAAGHWSAVSIYIDRSGPIGVQCLLNMHDGRQSASAGAGPPRAVAKLGLLNCYYRGQPIPASPRICQHSRSCPRRSASLYWPGPGAEPAPGATALAPIGYPDRHSPLCVNLRARGRGWRPSAGVRESGKCAAGRGAGGERSRPERAGQRPPPSRARAAGWS